MSGRSIVVSFFVICVSIGILIVNDVNARWSSSENRNYIDYNITGFINYTDLGDVSNAGFNDTYRNLTTYHKPADISYDFGFFKSLGYTWDIIKMFFTTVINFPDYLNMYWDISQYVIPLKILLLMNHLLTIIYLVTGKSFF